MLLETLTVDPQMNQIFFMHDKYIDHNMPDINRNDIPPRLNRDNVIDSQGKRLIDLCISTGFIIF
jgi:hypothetical protein